MTQPCQYCHQNFDLTPADLKFYDKIKIPAPTWCPQCRMMRRMTWRNERSLHRRECDLCKKIIISIYSPDKPCKVYCGDCYHSDKWNPMDYAMDIDFSKPFLSQVHELQKKVPRLYAFVFQNINSEYVNGAAFNKNCYLIFVSDHNEDCFYSYSIFDCKNSAELLNCNECELCYESVSCRKCYKTHFSQDCASSQNLYFCKNCFNCQDCFGCVNVRNAKFQIFNKQYSQQEYFEELAKLQLNSRFGLEQARAKAHQFWKQFPNKYIHGSQNTDVTGDYVSNSKNTSGSYDSQYLEDCKFLQVGNKVKDCYDSYVIVDNSENSMEVVSAITLNNVKFGYCVWKIFDCDYCDTCENSNNLFGCAGLRKKEYCILNKQYSQAEYKALREKIVKHMVDMPYKDVDGHVYKYGEFFPIGMSPVCYNESIANEYFPMTRQAVESKGFTWKDLNKSENKATVKAGELPDSGADEKYLKETIGCSHNGQCPDGCTMAFRLNKTELAFYSAAKLPLPDLCPNCRHSRRLKLKNPARLHERNCSCAGFTDDKSVYKNSSQHSHGSAPCAIKFTTTYAQDRPDIVYCEACYNAEVI